MITRQMAMANAERERVLNVETQSAAITTVAVASLALGATAFTTVFSGSNVPVLVIAALALVLSVIFATVGRAPSPRQMRNSEDASAMEAIRERVEHSEQKILASERTADPLGTREAVLENWKRQTELMAARADTKGEWMQAALFALMAAFVFAVSSLLPT